MAVVGVGLTSFLVSTLLYHVRANSTCMPSECLNCSSSNAGNCLLCSGNSTSFCDVPMTCSKDFKVQLIATSFTVDEGTQLNLTCVQDLPQNLTIAFEWSKNNQLIKGENRSILVMKIKETITLSCTVRSPCGDFSSAPQGVTVNDQAGIILLICGVSAVVIIILLAVIMKVLIKRNEVQREARKRHRQTHMQNISSTTTTVPRYW
ncbi:uncharacterized protein LOC118811269 [Colossoma macropomum]|uniref:uncharacterized protein LOC118811269 n=1 Tax=Colossoma macropomum TaxID=42526 RepID=UPI00186503C0|nr:uncharacterized protein LOC118811269 [Colossoma macropomum]XP_036431319.1 uncharacterized protein LOC118811269 [Colossoma macropomum]XP_036431320.1 uncharacterized protein LOC118811269 [Colossoma macropomum]XP_036431321.1 uncharacterized protein LOC118811269 [Colossoma macropomum]